MLPTLAICEIVQQALKYYHKTL